MKNIYDSIKDALLFFGPLDSQLILEKLELRGEKRSIPEINAAKNLMLELGMIKRSTERGFVKIK